MTSPAEPSHVSPTGRIPRRRRTIWLAIAVGAVVGSITATVLMAQSKNRSPPPPDGLTATMPVTAPFDIIDTPGSTYLLNRSTGQVWRLGFTEVKGDRYWFGTHVPIQQPGTFEELQQGLRKRLGTSN